MAKEMTPIQRALAQQRSNRKKEQQMRIEAQRSARLAMTAEARLSMLLDSVYKIFEDPTLREYVLEIDSTSVGIVSTALFNGKFAEYDATLDGNILILRQKVINL